MGASWWPFHRRPPEKVFPARAHGPSEATALAFDAGAPSDRPVLPAWRAYAEEVGGRLAVGAGGRLRIVVSLGSYVLTVAVVAREERGLTYAHLPYVSPDDFRFRIRSAGFLARLGRILARRDLTLGSPPFDERFVLQTNQETRLLSFLSRTRIVDLLVLLAEEGPLEYKAHAPRLLPDRRELLFQVDGVVTDLETLRALHELFETSVGQLQRVVPIQPLA